MITSNKKSRIFIQLDEDDARMVNEQLDMVIGGEKPMDKEILKDLKHAIEIQL